MTLYLLLNKTHPGVETFKTREEFAAELGIS